MTNKKTLRDELAMASFMGDDWKKAYRMADAAMRIRDESEDYDCVVDFWNMPPSPARVNGPTSFSAFLEEYHAQVKTVSVRGIEVKFWFEIDGDDSAATITVHNRKSAIKLLHAKFALIPCLNSTTDTDGGYDAEYAGFAVLPEVEVVESVAPEGDYVGYEVCAAGETLASFGGDVGDETVRGAADAFATVVKFNLGQFKWEYFVKLRKKGDGES